MLFVGIILNDNHNIIKIIIIIKLKFCSYHKK